jgi:microsomal dipeptidase-like Zn-dependent dipeptidase
MEIRRWLSAPLAVVVIVLALAWTPSPAPAVSPCGGAGQRACCFLEHASGACHGDTTEVDFCVGDCECAGGATAVSMCIQATTCGGQGQRSCCDGEGARCSAGLIEVPGCTGDCLCGGPANPDHLPSPTTCMTAETEDITEPSTNWTAQVPASACSLRGYADLHAHLFAHLGSGGAALAGKPYDPAGGVNAALAHDFSTDADVIGGNGGEIVAANCPDYIPADKCGAKLLHGDHFILLGIGVDDPLGAGTGDRPQSPLGAPIFNGWPAWTTTTHQQMYYKWIERAYRGGLRLMVMFAVTNEALCKNNLGKRLRDADCEVSMLPPERQGELLKYDERFRLKPGETPPADPLPPIEAQLQAAYQFEEWLDGQSGGPGHGWFRIVRTPAEARRVIAGGRLAVVLGIEVDHPFGCRFNGGTCTGHTIDFAIDQYYEKGVRHVFPIHNFDNQFGAPAAWQDAINVGNRAVTGHWTGEENCGPQGYGFYLTEFAPSVIGWLGFGLFEQPDYDEGVTSGWASCSANGLNPLSAFLLEKLKQKGMIVDVDHMSRHSLDETLTWAETNDYPVVASHAIFFDLHEQRFGGNTGRHERMRTAAQLQRIKNVGGMVAAMLKDDVQDTGERGLKYTVAHGTAIADDCIHTSKTWGQAYQYAVEQMEGPVAFGSDFNGVAGHLGPRFGFDACGGGHGRGSFEHGAWIVRRENFLRQLRAQNALQYPFTLAGFGTFHEQQTGKKVFNFNGDGLAHVGLLPDLVADLKQVGLSDTDLDPLFKSAEGYIKVWEKAARLPSPPGALTCADVGTETLRAQTVSSSIPRPRIDSLLKALDKAAEEMARAATETGSKARQRYISARGWLAQYVETLTDMKKKGVVSAAVADPLLAAAAAAIADLDALIALA